LVSPSSTSALAPSPSLPRGSNQRGMRHPGVEPLAMRPQGQREGNYDPGWFQSRTLRYSLRRVSPLDSINCGTHNPKVAGSSPLYKRRSDNRRKLENHAAAVALYYFSYNFIKIHRTLRMSPAMAAGVTDRLWEVSDLVALWESYEQQRAERAKERRKNVKTEYAILRPDQTNAR